MIPRIIYLPCVRDQRGNLSYIESNNQIPFKIEKAGWIYDASDCKRSISDTVILSSDVLIVAISGSLEIFVNIGNTKMLYHLNSPDMGLYIPAMTRHGIKTLSNDSVTLVISSYQSDSDYCARNSDLSHSAYYLRSKKYLQQGDLFDSSIIKFDQSPNIYKGNFSFVENEMINPYIINRVYFLYNVPLGVSRGGHAHMKHAELMVATSGTFHVTLDDGCSQCSYILNRPDQGLFIPSGIWHTLGGFSSDSTCLVLADDIYVEDDYIRDYQEFLAFKKQ